MALFGRLFGKRGDNDILVAIELHSVEQIRAALEGAAAAAVDEFGLNGHPPLFHTVNSCHNHAAPIMRMLVDAGARSDVAVRGITWGKGFEWAQFGLLPQG